MVLAAARATPAEAQRVRQVIDGDTITVSGVGVVRLIGVDAPEKTGGYRDSEPFGDAATKYMKALLEGQDVRLEYRRPAEGSSTTAPWPTSSCPTAGWPTSRSSAPATPRPTGASSTSARPEFFAAERDAKAARRGMWAKRLAPK